MVLISGSGPSPSHPSRRASFTTAGDDARREFRRAIGLFSPSSLRAIADRRGLELREDDDQSPAAALVAQFDDPAALAAIRRGLSDDEQRAVGLFALTESTSWPQRGLRHALAVLGVPAERVLSGLVERGLLAVAPTLAEGPLDDFSRLPRLFAEGKIDLLIHPALGSGGRVAPPTTPALRRAGAVAQIREADGLEPILRLAALWQRLGEEPLRRTQQGALYKRDRDRIEGDAVIAGPFRDAPAVNLPDVADLHLELAGRIGLIHLDRSGDYLMASPVDFWTENAVHLPQMVASAWLGLRSWREWSEPGLLGADPTLGEPWVCLRPSLLLWLAGLAPDDWVTLDDLAEHLSAVYPAWDRLSFREEPAGGGARRDRRPSREAGPRQALERVLLGGGFAMGLVRAADEQTTGRAAVQLTPLGRYALRVGPPPTAPPTFEKFLFAQPNLEVIAYRQGLTPRLIGELSQFAWWTKIDAAIELRLTRESIAGGLDWGMSIARMLDFLARHGQRSLPGSVKDAVERWASHRERVVFYEAATLVEFDSRGDRDQAVEQWSTADDGGGKPFVPVGERFILVEDARDVPTGRISTTAARDYRLAPERCVVVEDDGVTLTLDPSRSDLLIDAELARFADEAPAADRGRGRDRAEPLRPAHRRFVITPASLRRGMDQHGLTPALLADWFARRVGVEPPPAVKLMARPTQPKSKPWRAARRLVLRVPSAELLDGVLQHPLTRPWLGDRLGPAAVQIDEKDVEPLRAALAELGVAIEIS